MASCSLKFFMKFTVTRFSSRFQLAIFTTLLYTLSQLFFLSSVVCLATLNDQTRQIKSADNGRIFQMNSSPFGVIFSVVGEVAVSHQIDSCCPEQWAVHPAEKLYEFSWRSSFETTITSHCSSFSLRCYLRRSTLSCLPITRALEWHLKVNYIWQ